jgi:hypothetical protein
MRKPAGQRTDPSNGAPERLGDRVNFRGVHRTSLPDAFPARLPGQKGASFAGVAGTGSD